MAEVVDVLCLASELEVAYGRESEGLVGMAYVDCVGCVEQGCAEHKESAVLRSSVMHCAFRTSKRYDDVKATVREYVVNTEKRGDEGRWRTSATRSRILCVHSVWLCDLWRNAHLRGVHHVDASRILTSRILRRPDFLP